MAVEPMLKDGVVVRMVMENEGWWLSMIFPSSTIDIRWPMPGAGYKTILPIVFDG